MTDIDREIDNINTLTEENAKLQAEVNKLTALLYRLCDQFDNDFFSYSTAFMNNQNIARSIKSRLVMTPQIWDIVNNSKQPPEQSTDDNS